MRIAAQHAVVGRPPKHETRMVNFAVRLPESMLDEVDAEAKRIAPSGIVIGRGDLVRLLLREALDARRRRKPK